MSGYFASVFKIIYNNHSLFKFGVVGVLATLIHYAAANLTLFLLPYSVGEKEELFCNIVGYVSGFAISYLGNRYWSFSEQAAVIEHKKSLPRFILVWILGFTINQGTFYLVSQWFGFSFNVSISAGVVVAAMFAYISNKYFVFNQPKGQC